jgi:TolA-binding protein
MSPAETKSELNASSQGLVRLARDQLGEMSARHRAEGLLKINAHYVSRTSRSGRFGALVAAALVLGVTLLVGHWWLRSHAPPALSYSVQGGRIDATGVVQGNGGAEPTLRFSDGTRVAFLAGAQGRVKSVGQDGARIRLSGKIDVAVVPKPRGRWLFDAGPFLISVTGTAFNAEWKDAEQHLEIQLRTGAIQVSGASLHEPIALIAGQRLVISAREKQVEIHALERVSSARAATATQHVAVPGPEPSASGARAEPSSSASASAAASSTSNWTAELAAGRFSIILEQAEQRGLDSVLAAGSSDELAALSDAARYSRRDDVARRALAAQRRRFPHSSRASDAAFLLGRLEEAAQHPELALAWYERCLNESPRSTYASEALGRKMTLAQRLHGAAHARPIAQEYLRRFENGTYAAAAHALLRAP